MFISMRDVAGLLGIPSSSRASVNIRCPICDTSGKAKEKHLNINFDKNVFCCPKCSSGGSVVPFYAFMKYGTDPELVKRDDKLKKELIKELNDKGGFGRDYSEYKKKVVVPPPPKDFPVTSIDDRNKTYNEMLKTLSLSKAHYNDLIKRGLREKDIIKNSYVSTPFVPLDCNQLSNKGCDFRGVPGFYKKNNIWALRKSGAGYFIPVRDLQGKIQGMQIRLDDSTNMKYMWLSTADFEAGSGALTWAHLAGFPEETVYITEGPLKADIINRFKNVPVIAVPGVNALAHLTDMLNELKALGTKNVITCFDMDFKTNQNVQKGYNKLLSIIDGLGFSCKRLNWDENYKGYDDFLLHQYLNDGNSLSPFKK